jgi:hypothetical protein
MKLATRIGRLAALAVGLGIGAAWAHTPVASADPSSDWLSSVDGLASGGALPASEPTLNLAISFDGYSVVSDGTATAETTPGDYGLAIAYGNDASATAINGTGDYALADGDGSSAAAEYGNFDSAYAFGADTPAGAGYGNYDSAVAIDTGANAGALASGSSLLDSSNDSAFAWGLHSLAGAGDSFGNYVNGNDTALAIDPFGTVGSTAHATSGYYDTAAAFGDNTEAATGIGNYDLAGAFGDNLQAMTGVGDYLVDIQPPL